MAGSSAGDRQDPAQGQGGPHQGPSRDERRRGHDHADGRRPQQRGGIPELEGQPAEEAERGRVQDHGRRQEAES